MARTLSRTGAIAALAVAVMCHAAIAFAQEGWGTAPFNLSTPVSTGGAIFQPKIDVDGAGNAFAIWTDQGPNGIGTGAVVRSARYDAALRQWSGPLTLSTGERIAAAGDIAADAAGNAVAVWRINTISTPFFGRVSRYDATTRQWAYVDLGPLNFAIDDIAVALNDAGAGAVCWSSSASAGVACKRYTPGSGWAEATTVAAAGVIDGVGVDAAGTIHVLWHTSTSLQTARFDAGTSTVRACGGERADAGLGRRGLDGGLDAVERRDGRGLSPPGHRCDRTRHGGVGAHRGRRAHDAGLTPRSCRGRLVGRDRSPRADRRIRLRPARHRRGHAG